MKKIGDYVEVKDFDPVINLNAMKDEEEKTRNLVQQYIVTDEVQKLFLKILTSISRKHSPEYEEKLGKFDNSESKFHLITAGMGKGKSFFLLMLSMLFSLDSNAKSQLIRKLSKVNSELEFQINELKEKKYLQIFIIGTEYSEQTIGKIILDEIKEELKSKEINPLKYIKSLYSEAINNLIKIKENFGEKFEKKLDKLSGNEFKSIKDLQNELAKENAEALNVFLKCFEELTGSPPDLKMPKFMDTILSILDGIRKDGFDGLIIYFDELTTYMLSSQENKTINNDIGILQNLAEIGINRDDIFLVSSLHENIEDTIIEIQAKKNFEKLKGRCQNHPELVEFSFDQIITSILVVDEMNLDLDIHMELKGKYSEYFKNIHNLTQEFNFKSNWKKFYPFHPSTIFYLQRISEFSQSGRTALHFIKKILKENLDIKIINEDKIRFITTDTLWDYFSSGINKRKSELVIALKTLQEGKSDFDVKLIKTMGIVSASIATTTTSSQELVSITPTQLSNIYFIPKEDIYKKLMEIHDTAPGVYCDEDKFNLFESRFRIEMTQYKGTEEIIKQYLDKTNPQKTFVDIISEEIKYNYFPDIIQHLGIDWKNLKLYKHTFKDDKYNPPDIRENYASLVLLLPDIIEENQDKLQDFLNMIKTKIPNNTGFLLLNNTDFDIRELKRYEAIQQGINSTSVSQEMKNSLDNDKNKLENRFNRIKKQILTPENATVITKDKIIEGKILAQKNTDVFNKYGLAEFLMDSLKEIISSRFHKFPPIDNDNPIKSRAITNDIISKIIIPKDPTDATIRGPARNQVKFNLLNLGLVKKKGDNYIIQIPNSLSDSKLYEIFQIIDKNAAYEDNNLQSVYSDLQNEPFGIPDHLIELFLMFYVSVGMGYIEHKTQGKLTKKNFTEYLKDISIEEGKNYNIFKTKEVKSEMIEYINSTLTELLDYTGPSFEKITNENAIEFSDIIAQHLDKIIDNALNSIVYIKKINHIGSYKETNDIDNFVRTIDAFQQELLGQYKKQEISGTEFINSFYDFPLRFIEVKDPSLKVKNSTRFNAFKEKIMQIKLISDCKDVLMHICNWLENMGSIFSDSDKCKINKLDEIAKTFDELKAIIPSKILSDINSLKDFYNNEILENWFNYYSFYKELHIKYNNEAKKFMNNYEQSNLYVLAKSLSNLNIPNISDINNITAKIERNRMTCDNTNLTNIKNLTEYKCIICKKTICDFNVFIKDKDKNESSIENQVENIIQKRLSFIQDNISDFNQYLFENEPDVDSGYLKDLKSLIQEFMAANFVIDKVFLTKVTKILEDMYLVYNKFVDIGIDKKEKNKKLISLDDLIEKIIFDYKREINSEGVKTLQIKDAVRAFQKILNEIQNEYSSYNCNLEDN